MSAVIPPATGSSVAGAQHREPSLAPATCAASKLALDIKENPVFHIIEEPGGIKRLTEIEVPTEEYNTARAADMAARHPKCSAGLLEHLNALEPFLDTSVLAGFSYGVGKAFIAVIEGSLLGHKVNREGSHHEKERTEAIAKFPPLLNESMIRQFVGSTNWVRRYLLPCYATAVKILSLIHISEPTRP